MNMLSPFCQMLLIEGLNDWVPLVALRRGFLGKGMPSPQEFVQQSAVAMEPLLREGLMTLGDLSGPHGFIAWDLTVDQCLEKFKNTFLESSDQGNICLYDMWLCLTPKGEVVARKLDAIDPDPLHLSQYDDFGNKIEENTE